MYCNYSSYNVNMRLHFKKLVMMQIFLLVMWRALTLMNGKCAERCGGGIIDAFCDFLLDCMMFLLLLLSI